MEEGETVSILSRKELRKQKLMEYLAKKGRLKLPDPKAYLRDDFDVKKPVPSALKVVKGKENKLPADTLGYEGTKVQSLAAQSTRHPDRKAFTVTNKIQGSMMNGQKKPSSLCGDNGSTQLELKPSPVLTGMCSVVSSKSKLNTTSCFKKQSNRRNQASDRALSNGPSNSRFISSSNASQSGPMKTVSVRMSLGPLIKTKTGLIPAVIQPRNTKSHLTHTSATGAQATSTTTSVASKVRSSTSASVFQMSAMAQRKTRPTTVLNNPVNERPVVSSTTRARIKVQDQNKSGSKPLLGNHSQPSCKNQISSRLKSLPASKCTGAPIKQMGTNKSTHVPTDRSTQKKSEVGGEKNGKPVSRCNFRVVSGVAQAAVAGLGGKTKSSKDTQSKKGHSSANAPLPQTGLKRAGAPVLSQTVLQAARAISQPSGQATKTPKGQVNIIPQTEGKKVTAAQEERTRKLQEWREAKGISYKRPPMTVKPQVRHTVAVPQPFWTTMKEEDEAHSLICAVDRSLADCIKLLAEGCPRDQVKEVLSRLPAVSQKFAKYWICQARLMEQEGNLDVLPMFEEAVRVVLEPVDELRNVVFEILKKKDEFQASEANEEKDEQIATVKSSPESNNNSVMTPKPVRALICGEKGDSSVVKYKITKTPGGPRSQQGEPAQVNGQEVRFFTPVRRSVRIKRASLRYPASLQDHDLCVASYSDLISEEDKEKSEEPEGGETSPSVNDTPMYIYRQNEALKDKVFVQLVCD